MTNKEKLNRAASDLEKIIEMMIADVPEPDAADRAKSIEKILDLIMDEELERPIDKIKSEVITACLHALPPIDKSQA